MKCGSGPASQLSWPKTLSKIKKEAHFLAGWAGQPTTILYDSIKLTEHCMSYVYECTIMHSHAIFTALFCPYSSIELSEIHCSLYGWVM